MTFLAPGLAIAGLLAASIPIIIHLLLRRRRRPIEWAAMALLMEAARRHRRRSLIERILLLALRVLLLALLDPAFLPAAEAARTARGLPMAPSDAAPVPDAPPADGATDAP